MSIKAEFTFSAHFVFGAFILFSLKAFRADIQYRLNAPSLSLSPKITRSFYFYFVFPLVGRRFAVWKIENGSREEMEEKWRRRRFVSQRSVVFLCDEISVSRRKLCGPKNQCFSHKCSIIAHCSWTDHQSD